MSKKLQCLYEYEVDFDTMTEEQKHNYINERDGEIVEGIGVNSDGHEFRDDNGLALIFNSKDYIVKLYEKTFDEGIDCEYCEYSKSILEPHGEITRHCSMEHYHEECPTIENALNYYN